MNHKTIKTLHGAALILQCVALLLTVLMTIGQKAVETLIKAPYDLRDINTIPFEVLVCVIPMFILFAISFFLMKKNDGSNSKTHTIVCIVLAIAIQIIAPLISALYVQVFALTQGVNAYAAHVVLVSAIERILSPLLLIAFALFCLSLGGYYVSKKTEE